MDVASRSNMTESSITSKSRKRHMSNSNEKVSVVYNQSRNTERNRLQSHYVAICTQKACDINQQLLRFLGQDRYVLSVDTLGQDELSIHSRFLAKCKVHEINVSYGTVPVKRDLRHKFARLGIARAYACTLTGAQILISAVCASSMRCSALQSLTLQGVHITQNQAELLAKTATTCSSLQTLSLSRSQLGDLGMEAIALHVGKIPSLYHIDLSKCNLTDESRKHIVKLISLYGICKDETAWTSSLRTDEPEFKEMKCPQLLLDLSDNGFGDLMLSSIQEALCLDRWLLGINLNGNKKISANGVTLLCDRALKINTTISVLSLRGIIRSHGPCKALDILQVKMWQRKGYLQRFVSRSREIRMSVCKLLMEWGLSRDFVLEICEGGAPIGSDIPPDDNTEIDRMDYFKRKQDNVTIQFLMTRLSGLESAHRATCIKLGKMKRENAMLRAQIETLQEPGQDNNKEDAEVEARLIHQIEKSLSALTGQIEDLKEH